MVLRQAENAERMFDRDAQGREATRTDGVGQPCRGIIRRGEFAEGHLDRDLPGARSTDVNDVARLGDQQPNFQPKAGGIRKTPEERIRVQEDVHVSTLEDAPATGGSRASELPATLTV